MSLGLVGKKKETTLEHPRKTTRPGIFSAFTFVLSLLLIMRVILRRFFHLRFFFWGFCLLVPHVATLIHIYYVFWCSMRPGLILENIDKLPLRSRTLIFLWRCCPPLVRSLSWLHWWLECKASVVYTISVSALLFFIHTLTPTNTEAARYIYGKGIARQRRKNKIIWFFMSVAIWWPSIIGAGLVSPTRSQRGKSRESKKSC